MRPNRQTAPRRSRADGRDEGTVLILVLVLMVIASMIILPLLNYSMSVSKANTVLSSKTRRQEAAKAGLRLALSDPTKLYSHCFNFESLATVDVDGIGISTSCAFLASSQASHDDELHLGLAATRMGATVPNELAAVTTDLGDGEEQRLIFQMQSDRPTNQWYVDPPGPEAPYTHTAVSRSLPQHIWAPNLPVRSNALRSSIPYTMEGADCDIFFPGTYRDPLVVDGPTYFTSGIYYFENIVVVTGTADAVVGGGSELGCATDQDAAFYAGVVDGGVFHIEVPAPHQITGLGATFVIGSDSRLIITNDAVTVGSTTYPAGPAKLRFNQRYVQTNPPDFDTAASFGVSIVSVNGAVDGVVAANGTYTPKDLDVPGVIKVPVSKVGGVGLPTHYLNPRPLCADQPEAPECVTSDACPAEPGDPAIPCSIAANTGGYLPSTHTHAPRIPTAPRNVQVAAFKASPATSGGVFVTWDAPERPGGLPIQYQVTVRRTDTSAIVGTPCVQPAALPDIHDADPLNDASGTLECFVSGLPALSGSATYQVAVKARNTLGDSPEAAPVNGGAWTSLPTAAVPDVPAFVDPGQPAVAVDPDSDPSLVSARVSWTAPTSTGTTRITKYTVQAFNTPALPDPLPDPAPPPPTPVLVGECSVSLPLLVADPVDPDWPSIVPTAPTPPSPLFCHIPNLDPALAYSYTLVAENYVGASTLVASTSETAFASPIELCDASVAYPLTTESSLSGCGDWVAPLPVVRPYEPDPVVDIILSAPTLPDAASNPASRVVVSIPGYIAVPQGVFRLFDPNSLTIGTTSDQFEISGGIVAASFRVRVGDGSSGGDETLTVPVGLLNLPIQRTFKITTTASGLPKVVSTAVVQVNENGAYAINSWEVQ